MEIRNTAKEPELEWLDTPELVRAGTRDFVVETGWLMQPLLDECLQWPKVTPHVRESDGIRRLRRCWSCKRREHPDEAVEQVCDECLALLIDIIQRRTPPEGIIFF